MAHSSTCSLDHSGGRCEMDANLEIYRNVAAFSGIPIERLKLLAYLSKRVYYRAGEFLFHHGDIDDRAYLILSGKAQVIRELSDHSVFLHEFTEGDFFGGLALLSDIKRRFSIKAITDLECLTINRESFQKLLLQFPEIAIKMLDPMIKRMVQMEEEFLKAKTNQCLYG
ncbi:cyclic nucleotide-binding domain-containing protein [Desulforhabdus amnigena]|uniref:cyclic nucleotide-binding domain-containing protein n=1 Tax=Desulforhabdus amnigena TaxID=40218 RepID=UPI001695801B|nr:cyclic nucleotide-binding domain-containing protein [Desulforhabdus amnigena]NLJ28538.1 cyclic nucleotide-binding domain-containing protein [Deltaproteobacteria bacterium]